MPDAGTLDAGADTADDLTVRARVENGVATDSIVTDAGCVAFAWTGRTAVITFTDCVSEATGLTLDGAVTFAVTLRPTTCAITLDDLAIAGTTIDGSVTMVVGGAASARTYTLDADLSWTGTDASAMTLTDVVVSLDDSAMHTTLAGAFAIEHAGASASGTLDAVRWALPDCHPSSGSARFSIDGGREVVATFLPTTPTAGTVSIAAPPLPAVEMNLLGPCTP